MIEKLVAQLKADEGFKPSVYTDSLGYATIGYGFLIDARKGGEIPRGVAEIWLEYLAEQTWYELHEKLPWLDLQPPEVRIALCNMAYQLGVPGVLNFKLMLGALERGDRETAAANALASLWSKQTPKRAERIAAAIRGPKSEREPG